MQLSLGSVRQWHWISAAFALIGMLMFAITGITLNHAADIKVTPVVKTIEVDLPPSLVQSLKKMSLNAIDSNDQTVPNVLTTYLDKVHSISVSSSAVAEWSEDELYVIQAGPGKDAWFAIDFFENHLTYEKTDRGWIAYFNDLHKGRDTGIVWGWFIDVFAAICVIFSVSGLVLMYRQANHRWMTWPVTMLGLIVPSVLLLIYVN